MKTKPFFNDYPRGFTRPLNHGEFFEKPLEYVSGYHNADVRLSGDGVRPATWQGEVIIDRPPGFVSPGIFGKHKGRLVKARSLPSLRDRRWVDPSEHSRVSSDNERRRRIREGVLYQPPPPKLSKEEREARRHAQEQAEYEAESQRLASVAPPPPDPVPLPSAAGRHRLLARVAAHNAPESTGPRPVHARAGAPEMERHVKREQARVRRQLKRLQEAAKEGREVNLLPPPPRRLREPGCQKSCAALPRARTLPQPSDWTPPSRAPGLLAFCADLRLALPEFKPAVLVALKPRVISEVSTASPWGASRL